jgi:hypothetical protein
MQVNRPSASIDIHQNQVNTPHSASVSGTSGPTASARVDLKSRVTPRTEDYLQRLRAHGNLTQQSLASSACSALANDLFIANPARDKPVFQFGVSMTLDGRKGLLLANFMPHDNKLELEALAFRAQQFFDTEAGSIEKVVLEHAKVLPTVQAAEHSRDVTANSKLPEPRRPLQSDIEAERKAVQKEAKRFDSQTMRQKMTSKLADMRIADGRSTSLRSARAAAHVTIAGAKVRQLFQRGTPKPQQISASDGASVNSALSTPLAYNINLANKNSQIFMRNTGSQKFRRLKTPASQVCRKQAELLQRKV